MAQWNKDAQAYRAQDTTNFEVVMLADGDGNIQVGGDISNTINISADAATGYSGINKFGYREIDAHLTNYYSVTSQGDYDFPSSAGTASVSSTDTANDNGGTVLVSGLDANYAEVEETITVGQSGSQQFLRVNRARLVTANHSSGRNQGNISVDIGSDTVAYIPTGYGQTLQAIYTVPAGKTGYIFQMDGGVDEKEKPVHFRIVTRDNTVANAAWNTRQFMVMESNYVSQKQTIPIRVTEKSDIVLEANSTSGQIEVSGGFEIVLVDN